MTTPEIIVKVRAFAESMEADGADGDEMLTALVFSTIRLVKATRRMSLGNLVKLLVDTWERVE